MSDGWVATQNGEYPRIAMFPVSAPGSVAWQPDPTSRLLHGIVTSRKYGHLVRCGRFPADGGYGADLAGSPVEHARLPIDDHGDLGYLSILHDEHRVPKPTSPNPFAAGDKRKARYARAFLP